MATKWDKKRSDWYCRAVEKSNYPGKAVTSLTTLLRKCTSVIDIGAGCGALSVPIARKVKKVTAIEPSKWMFELLLKRSKKAGIKNIRAYNTGWKGNMFQGGLHSTIKSHDMVICANLPHNLVCNRGFLEYITKISSKYIVFIQSAGRWNRFYYEDLYPKLLKKRYKREADYIETYFFLHKQGIFANIKMFDYYFDQPFDDFNDALDFWKHRLKLKLTSKKEKILADFLNKKLVPLGRAGALTAPFGLRKAALIWWKT